MINPSLPHHYPIINPSFLPEAKEPQLVELLTIINHRLTIINQ